MLKFMKSPQSKNIVTQFKTIVKAFFFSDLRFLKGFFEFVLKNYCNKRK